MLFRILDWKEDVNRKDAKVAKKAPRYLSRNMNCAHTGWLLIHPVFYHTLQVCANKPASISSPQKVAGSRSKERKKNKETLRLAQNDGGL
jgi:hypothetical protein